MHIFRKTLFLLSLFVAGFTSQAKAQISVMTFNIRLDASVDNENRWDCRKAEVAKMLTYYQPDLLGLQEVCPNQMADLKSALQGMYEGIGVGRDDGKHQGEHSPIFYNKHRFSMVKHGDFALSEHPEQFGKRGWDASYNRVCTWAILKDKKTGKQVVYFNTHLDNDGKIARKEGIKLILSKMKKVAKNMPAIITGDFNCTDEEEPSAILRANKMENARNKAAIVYGPDWTWHDYGRLPLAERNIIDHIFVSNNLKVTRYRVIGDKPDKVYLSDHNAVFVNLDYTK